MITSIYLKNVKSIKENQGITLDPLTLLIGENGSGKSSFLQVLSLLSQNPPAPSLQDGHICRQGGYEQLCNDNTQPISVILKGVINISTRGYSYLNKLHYDLTFQYFGRNSKLDMTSCKITSDDPNDFLVSKSGKQNKILFENEWTATQSSPISFETTIYDEIAKSIFKVALGYSPYWHYSVTQWIQTIPTELKNRLNIYLSNLNQAITKEFENIIFVPALRGIDTQNHELLDKVDRQPVNAYDFNNQAKLLASSLAYNRNLENKVSEILESVLKRKCRANLQEGKVISVETKVGEKWVNIMNEGFGANPLIHLIYQFVAAPPNSIILIEEPEIHLFPAAQKQMIIQLVKQAQKENKKLLITTHSAHVYSMLSKIKEDHDSDVKIYFFKKESDVGTHITEITQANREGILRDFMKMDVEELADMIENARI